MCYYNVRIAIAGIGIGTGTTGLLRICLQAICIYFYFETVKIKKISRQEHNNSNNNITRPNDGVNGIDCTAKAST